MQSEELEDSASKEAQSTSEMTVSATRESPSPKLQPQVISQYSQDSEYSLERMKLESLIEKVSPDSPLSSDTAEEEESNPRPTIIRNTTSPQLERPNPGSLSHLQEQIPNESIRSWLQRITQMQNEIQKKLNLENNSSLNHSFKEFPVKNAISSTTNFNNQPQTPSKVVKYQDLPYMGEMTLDNSKPRRGRKPKKADICHLIYKNYGTIFPGTPDSKNLVAPASKKKLGVADNHLKDASLQQFNKSDVQNKIISSLLERRLTQETKRNKESSETKFKKTAKRETLIKAHDQDEPLNLCIKDLNQLKIRLLKKHSNTYVTDSALEVKAEPQSDDEVEFVNATPSPTSSLDSPDLKFPGIIPADLSPNSSTPELIKTPENGVAPGGYIYWPNAGVFIHPMALQQHLMYYQRMAANSNYTLPSHSPKPPPELDTKSVPELRKLAPKIRPKKTEAGDDLEPQSMQEQKTKRNAPSTSDRVPTKRKRSAIFIPPIPAENQTNPATEVSICKFKFTGGAKPSLQEKKMLSVDSGGNFRYYSGTGDKSMRGYEFFPRETLQQQVGSAHGSSTGAFLQASGEKIFPPPIDFTGKQSHPDFMLTPELPASNLGAVAELNSRHKKRKSRKSLQREKLEQTFKEKGFLIQTQQLESAEGATYCKFRQLRKFTRYLFRSWKDYLPGNVRELQEGEQEREHEIDELSGLPTNRLTPNSLKSPL